jgi:hypothetical protein
MSFTAKRRVKEAVLGDGRDGDRRAEAELVLRIRRLAAELNEGDLLAILARLLSGAAAEGPRIERAIVVWINLVEELVHDAEWRYPGTGMGPMRAAAVREAFRYLVGDGRLTLPMPPGLPPILYPLVADIATRWAIDAIVAVLNDRGGWEPPPRSRTLRVRAALAWLRLLRAIASSRLARLLVRLTERIWAAAFARPPLSPGVRQAIRAVEKDGRLDHARDAIAGLVQLTIDVGRNRGAFLAGVRLVGIVVRQVERFTWLDGPGKRLAASRLIVAVVQDAGLAPRGEAFSLLLDAAVGMAIECVVSVFNKRGLLVHGATPALTDAAPGR